MKYKVFIIADAEEDLYEIFRYVARFDSVAKAEFLIDKLEATCQSLSEFAHRGHIPPELESISLSEYREIFCNPYRIIYQINNTDVFIHCVLDGRRDLQDILQERLLR